MKILAAVVIVTLAGVAILLVHRVWTQGREPFPEIRFGEVMKDLPRVVTERVPADRPEPPAAEAVEAPAREPAPLDAGSIEEVFPGALTAYTDEGLRRLYDLGRSLAAAGDAAAALDAFDSVVRADPQSHHAFQAYVQIGPASAASRRPSRGRSAPPRRTRRTPRRF